MDGDGILADDGDMTVMFCLVERLKIDSLEARVRQKKNNVPFDTSSIVVTSYGLAIVEVEYALPVVESNSVSLCPR